VDYLPACSVHFDSTMLSAWGNLLVTEIIDLYQQ